MQPSHPQPEAPDPADRLLTVPNVLSLLRLAGVPLFLWLLLGPRYDLLAMLVLALSGLTDWLDGKLARLLNQSSRLGELLDPAVDQLYTLSTLLAFGLRGILPWWVVVGRDVVLSLTLPVLRHHGYGPLAVHDLGKAATLCLLYLPAAVTRRQCPGLVAGGGRGVRNGLHRMGRRAVPLVGGSIPLSGSAHSARGEAGEPWLTH